MGLFEKGVEKEKNSIKPRVLVGKNEKKEIKEKTVVKNDSKKEVEKYKTDIDRLLSLVHTSKSVNMDKIPNILGIDIVQVEELAKTLEKSGLIEVYYPAMGSPLLRTKGFAKRDEKDKTKKKIEIAKILGSKYVYLSIVVLVVVSLIIGSIFLYSFIKKDVKAVVEEDIVEEVVEEVVVGDIFNEEVVSLEMAFSGSGSYYCDATKSGYNTEYWILDEDEKLITSLGNSDSTVIIKDDTIYTYIESSDTWITSDVTDSTSRPGSSVPDLDSAVCKTFLVNETFFNIEEGKIQ
ncbi:MAG: hypothetical protein ABIJ18_00340 [archaeon]